MNADDFAEKIRRIGPEQMKLADHILGLPGDDRIKQWLVGLLLLGEKSGGTMRGESSIGNEKRDTGTLSREQVQRRLMTSRLRFKIFQRDGHRCRLCGRSAADGAVLQVDHKKPISRGGMTTEDNLWTLCRECNSGKGDYDLREANR